MVSESSLGQFARAIPPRGRYRHGFRIVEEYSRVKDETTVRVDVGRIRYGQRGQVACIYTHQGSSPCPPRGVVIPIVSETASWRYRNYADAGYVTLTWLLNGNSRINVDSSNLQWDGSVLRGYVVELVYWYATLDEFLQLVNANTIEFCLCNDELVVSKKNLEALRDAASRMRP
jgi:hypothetical protein